jgi:hypothetical protein
MFMQRIEKVVLWTAAVIGISVGSWCFLFIGWLLGGAQ